MQEEPAAELAEGSCLTSDKRPQLQLRRIPEENDGPLPFYPTFKDQSEIDGSKSVFLDAKKCHTLFTLPEGCTEAKDARCCLQDGHCLWLKDGEYQLQELTVDGVLLCCDNGRRTVSRPSHTTVRSTGRTVLHISLKRSCM